MRRGARCRRRRDDARQSDRDPAGGGLVERGGSDPRAVRTPDPAGPVLRVLLQRNPPCQRLAERRSGTLARLRPAGARCRLPVGDRTAHAGRQHDDRRDEPVPVGSGRPGSRRPDRGESVRARRDDRHPAAPRHRGGAGHQRPVERRAGEPGADRTSQGDARRACRRARTGRPARNRNRRLAQVAEGFIGGELALDEILEDGPARSALRHGQVGEGRDGTLVDP